MMCAYGNPVLVVASRMHYPLFTKYVTVSIDWDGLVGLVGIMVIVGFRKRTRILWVRSLDDVGGGACAAWRGRNFGGKGSEWRLGCGRQRGEVNRSRPGVKEVSSILRQRFDLTRGGPKRGHINGYNASDDLGSGKAGTFLHCRAKISFVLSCTI